MYCLSFGSVNSCKCARLRTPRSSGTPERASSWSSTLRVRLRLKWKLNGSSEAETSRDSTCAIPTLPATPPAACRCARCARCHCSARPRNRLLVVSLFRRLAGQPQSPTSRNRCSRFEVERRYAAQSAVAAIAINRRSGTCSPKGHSPQPRLRGTGQASPLTLEPQWLEPTHTHASLHRHTQRPRHPFPSSVAETSQDVLNALRQEPRRNQH